MFAFEYKNNKYITVYFDTKDYYFDYDEIRSIIGKCRLKRCGGGDGDGNACDKIKRIVLRMKRQKFLSFDETLVLLDCYEDTGAVEDYIIEILYPILIEYKKTL
ncbi:hypothetical protein [Alphabaculovirus myunipunctae]|uniref:Uncharacterized protein n=1 Tax=Mythimna unipuncta nucleopolyhedrovirus TaxID=447897 RepID=A0A2K9VSG1_9ABAC|nr:hypothetical protein [Mythimna unipuncta nucleopolyhedrovirus]AUV65397.1 hypothetical protein [Mythimna unipuncta nucleopolyhedrovirus]